MNDGSLAEFTALAESLPHLTWLAEADGTITWYNQRWYDYTGTTPEQVLGWGWKIVHDPVVLPEVLRRWQHCLDTGTAFDMIVPLRGIGGAYRPFLTRVSPIRDTAGHVIRWLGTNTDIAEQEEAAEALRREKEHLETLKRTAELVARELELQKLVQTVTDAGVALTGAQFGAFFYNVISEKGEAYTLYTISGVPREAFAHFPMPRNTAIFHPTFAGTGILRSDDITNDSRYGHNSPYRGMPEGHLPVRSYLAVPVVSRSGEVLGGLFFGHPEAGRFSARHEELVVGIAAQASVGIDNARLVEQLQRELDVRRAAERHRELLINELNHRVKNTLATVQSVVSQTLRTAPSVQTARGAIDARLIALAHTHDLLTRENWEHTALSEVVQVALGPFRADHRDRFRVVGPELQLAPKTAVAFAMALHELLTNAVKYGALSKPEGRVVIGWQIQAGPPPRLTWIWRERGGPPAPSPTRKGFGLRLIESGLAAELDGSVQVTFEPEGLTCSIDAPLPQVAEARA